MTATTDLAVTVWPGIEPRLLRMGGEDYAQYRESGGYQPLDDADGLLGQVDLSGVLGRGGAAFPLAVKLKTVRDNGRTPVARSWSPTVKRANPRRSRTDGCCGTARTWCSTGCGSRRGWRRPSARLCLRPQRRRAVQTALAAIDEDVLGGLSITVMTVEPATSQARDGAVRTQRRPRQADGQAAAAVRRGRRRPSDDGEQCRDARAHPVHRAAWRRGVPRAGTSTSPGTFLATITGAGRPPALYELPHGVAFAELLEFHGVQPIRCTAC